MTAISPPAFSLPEPIVRRWGALLAVLGLGLSHGCAQARATILELRAQSITGPGFSLQQPRLRLHTLGHGGERIDLSSAALQFGRHGGWQQATFACTLHTSGPWRCDAGTGQILSRAYGPLSLHFSGAIAALNGAAGMQLTLRGKRAGDWRGQWQSTAGGTWHGHLQGQAPAQTWLASLLPPHWHSSGTLVVTGQAQGASWHELSIAAMDVEAHNLGWQSPDGLQAAEHGRASLRVVAMHATDWRGSAVLHWQKGALLWTPWFAEAPKEGPVQLSSNWLVGKGFWELRDGELRWPGLGQAGFRAGRMGRQPLAWSLDAREVQMRPFYAQWIRPILSTGSVPARLDAAGVAEIALRFGPGLRSARWRWRDGALTDPRGYLRIDGISSSGHWSATGPGRAGLNWREGAVYALPFGALDGDFTLGPHTLESRSPMQVALLGGSIGLRNLRASWRTGRLSLRMNGALHDLQLAPLTRDLGWPPFSGTLSASLPQLAYADGRLSTDGTLAAQVFGGQVEVRDLAISHFLGTAPVLTADIRLHRLHLRPMTDVFHFGYINGALDGYIHHLVLLDWRPVSFDARLYSQREPGLEQEISATAIENLSRLGGGGGIGGLFQGLYLRLFKTFHYEKLGMGVRLTDGVAELSGIGGAEDAEKSDHFTLLQGAGLPRVNIVGYNRRTQWSELVSRLLAAIRGETPIQGGP